MFLIDIFDYKKDVIQPERLRYQLISAWAGGLFSGQILIMTMDKVSYIMETNTDRLKEDYSSRGLEKNKVRVIVDQQVQNVNTTKYKARYCITLFKKHLLGGGATP